MDNEVYHHGVKGMKWGVRRYQNKDGTLTNTGKKRLIEAKTENLQSAKRIEELYKNALDAMKNYSGHMTDSEEDKDDEY